MANQAGERLQPQPSVLVVEDNEDVVSLLEHVLKREGYRVRVARDGDTALQIIDGDAPFSLVLLDLMVPIHSGYEILRHLRQCEPWRNVPVIVLTSRSREDDVRKTHRLGADDCLAKPFEPGALLAQIRSRVAPAPA